MERLKKRMAASVAVIFLLTIAGCENNNGLSQVHSEPPLEITWWSRLYPHIGKTAGNFSEIEFYQELERRTNTKLTFIHPSTPEHFNLMVSSGDLPDLIEKDFINDYSGGVQKAVDSGIIIEIDQYIDQNAPNYKRVLEQHPDWDKQVKLDSGKHYTFAWFRGDESLTSWKGLQLREDLLERAGLPLPETVADWDAVLRSFKKQGVDYPFSPVGEEGLNAFVGPFGIGVSYYQEDGRVKYGPREPAYKDYLALLNRWYQQGLLDPDFFAQDEDTLDAKVINGQVAVFNMSAGGSMGKYIPVLAEKFPGAKLAGTKYPVMNRGEIPRFGQKDFEYFPETSVTISTSCKYPAKVAGFLDYGYSEEGHMFYNFGIENVSYQMIDGYPKYTSLITDNPDGLAMQYAMSRYMASAYGGPFVQDKRYFEQYLKYPEQKEAVERWKEQDASSRIPPVAFTEPESELLATTGKRITQFVKENNIRFITGQQSLELFDEYLSELQKMGIEEVIEAYQNALNRYNDR